MNAASTLAGKIEAQAAERFSDRNSPGDHVQGIYEHAVSVTDDVAQMGQGTNISADIKFTKLEII